MYFALEKDVNQSYYNVWGVIEEYTFCMYSAIYEELPSKGDKIGIAGTLETVHDDVEFYKIFDHSFEGPQNTYFKHIQYPLTWSNGICVGRDKIGALVKKSRCREMLL